MPFRPQILRYLHDCYREDNSRSTLWNLQGSGAEHLIFLRGNEELLDGFLDETPLPLAKARAAAAAANTYQKEKQLLYAAFPIIGTMALGDGKTRQVCSPLFTFPASIVLKDGYASLSIERERRRTNSALLDALQSGADDTPLADQVDTALDDWQISELEVAGLTKVLCAGISGLDAATMWQFPSLTDAKTLRAAAGSATMGSGFKLFPAAALCLVKRPTESRGVLTELQEIADAEEASTPLSVLLSGIVPPPAEPDTRADTTPAVLSHSQTRILRRARTEPLSLVIGPPGTGKSYTIAAIALDHLNRGESVLIGSKMNHAVDVIATKIEDQLGASGKVVRAGRRHYLRELKHYIETLLDSSGSIPGETQDALSSISKSLARADAEVGKIERMVERLCDRHLAWGDTLAALASGSRSPLKRISGFLITQRNRRRAPLWEWVNRLHELLDKRSLLASELLKHNQQLRIEEGLKHHRSAIKTLRSALGARTGTRQEELFSSIDLDTLLGILPAWLVNLSDAHRVLPNRRELFDVAIIDEASQCDIASCLPLLQRARRAVIVGDPKQLRHLSFLATDQQREFASAHGLTDRESATFDYRNRSILDLASERTRSQECINFLNEHFRSEPAIIRFSNKEFYSDQLNIMTDRPGKLTRPAVLHLRCHGQRDHTGINSAEADAVIGAISDHLEDAGEIATPPASIGVLSPFRAQVDHLAALINRRFGNDIFARHQILVGTAHTFQGEERDLMFLSFAIDASSPAASRRFLERPDLFNVAITRARQRQFVFSSIDPVELPPGSLLRRYLAFIETANDPIPRDRGSGLALLDGFAREVRQELESRGYGIWLGCSVAGLRIDLLAARDGASLAIDLIGCPGPTAHVFPLERYKMFHRAGLTLWPLAYTDWLHRRQLALEAIDAQISRAATGNRR